MKVLHCPTTVGGNPQGVSRAERAQGADSVSWTLTQNLFAYPADRVICSFGGRLAVAILRWWAIREMIRGGFDVVHFNFGQSFSPLRTTTAKRGIFTWPARIFNRFWAGPLELSDVVWVRRRGAIVAVTYQGDDARQGGYSRTHYPEHFAHEVNAGYYTTETDLHKQERIQFFDRHADLIYALNPDLLSVLPARAQFLPYASVDPREWLPVYGKGTSLDCPELVHAPSNREVKGTKYLLQAVEQLRREGVRFRFTLVEGVSHAEARRLYENADLAVDQLLAGFYGAFAVELMALGKPVICQLNQGDLSRLPDQMRKDMPLIHASPASIYAVLKDLLSVRKHQLRALGMQSRTYVERWHDPRRIAERLLADYQMVLKTRIAVPGIDPTERRVFDRTSHAPSPCSK